MPRKRIRISPPPPRGISHLDITRNGVPAVIQSANRAARYINSIAATRLKILCQHDFGQSGEASSLNITSVYRGLIRTSSTVEKLRLQITVLPANSTATGVTPNVRAILYAADSLSWTLTTPLFYTNKRGTGVPVPSDYSFIDYSWKVAQSGDLSPMQAITPNTEYIFAIWTTQYARIKNFCLYEESNDTLWKTPKTDTGTPDEFAKASYSLVDYTTLTDNSRTFDETYIGAPITISGATEDLNNGTFTIVDYGTNTLTYDNKYGQPRSSSITATYQIKDRIIANADTAGSGIVQASVEEYRELIRDIWKYNGGHLFDWSDYDNAKTVTTSGWESPFDAALNPTTVADDDPGHWVWPENMGSYESDNVPCELWCSVGTSSGDLEFRYADDDSVLGTFEQISTSGIGNTSGYYHKLLVNLDATDTARKIIPIFRETGASTFTLYGYGLRQYEPKDDPVTPGSLFASDIEFWFRADSGITLSGSEVTAWTDLSPNGNDLSYNAGALTGPTYDADDSEINDKPSVNFAMSAPNSLIFDSPPSQTATWTVCAVVQNTSPSYTNYNLFLVRSGSGDVPYPQLGIPTGAGKPAVYDATLADSAVYGSQVSGWHLYVWKFRTLSLYRGVDIDGSSAGEVSTTSGSVSALTTWQYLGYPSGTTGADMDLAEVFCIKRFMTDEEQDALVAYVNSRYGLSLS